MNPPVELELDERVFKLAHRQFVCKPCGSAVRNFLRYLILPTASLPAEVQKFIVQKCLGRKALLA